jgi:hypothetical protein
MPDIPLTQILVLLAFVLLPLLGRLLQRMQRPLESQAPGQPPSQPASRVVAKQPLEVTSARERAHAPDRAESSVVTSQRRKRLLFRNGRDLRRAIILMTVLGPCRANRPED